MECDWEFGINLDTYAQLILDKGAKPFSWERTVFSINDNGTTRYPHAKKKKIWIRTPLLYYKQTATQNGSKTSMLELKILKLLKENIGANFCDLRLGDGFLDMTS